MTDETSMIVELFGKVAALEADRDAWKRRAEAAERDLGWMLICQTCKYAPIGESPECAECESNIRNNWRRSKYAWRGPCAENGGIDSD